MPGDFLFSESLSQLDPNLHELIQIKTERQLKKLILIPRESYAPSAVREALGSTFQNIYAEGYPDEATRWMTEEQLLEYPARLTFYRKNSDDRYYKGVEYVDVVESLERRHYAELFTANSISADSLYVTEKEVRMAHSIDPVLDEKGHMIGSVTSCAIDSEGWLTGHAYIQTKHAGEGNEIFIYQGAPQSVGKAPSELSPGDHHIKLPGQAIIISRFPKL